jgi:hypothetical protein
MCMVLECVQACKYLDLPSRGQRTVAEVAQTLARYGTVSSVGNNSETSGSLELFD